MIGTRIRFNLAHAEQPSADVVRRLGSDGPWSIFVLNGRGRRFHAQGAGAFSLKWMASGRARYELDRRGRMVTRGTAMLVDQDQPYEVEFDAPAESESFCVFFDRTLVAEAWASVEAGFDMPGESALRGFPNVPFTPSPKLASLLDHLHEDGLEGDADLIEHRLLSVLQDMIATAHRHRGQAARIAAGKPVTRSHLLTLVERARECMIATNGVDCDLGALSTEVGVSKFHLLRLFKAVHGLTPIAYAERLRMEAAATRLRSSPRSIGDIAADLGYESPSAFAKAFRRWTGAAPTHWRN
jgi:AraC-like DNA-binding protein